VIFDVKPAVVGHRGFGSGTASGYRENSVESFLAAAASGVMWVELDVRRSSDGELMVWHDPRSPSGRAIITQTAAQLGAEGIVALVDVLAALPVDVGVNIDVKTVIEDATEPEQRRTHALLAAALADYGGTRPFLVSSFDPSVPVYLRGGRADGAALGLITSENLAADQCVAAAANLGLDAACVYTATLRLDHEDPGRGSATHTIELAHQAGLEVMTWTATPAQAVRAAAAGIDAVCVDDIPAVLAALAGAGLVSGPLPPSWREAGTDGR
jgi:glycerophosphoryl diester phosphodiesterase